MPFSMVAVCSAASRAACAACFCLRFAFFLLIPGARPVSAGWWDIPPFVFVVCAIAGEGSEESLEFNLGTVMNFEPSLLVYLAVNLFGEVGDRAGDWAVC